MRLDVIGIAAIAVCCLVHLLIAIFGFTAVAAMAGSTLASLLGTAVIIVLLALLLRRRRPPEQKNREKV